MISLTRLLYARIADEHFWVILARKVVYLADELETLQVGTASRAC